MITDEYLLRKAKAVYTEYKSSRELQQKITVKTVVSAILTALWYFIWVSSAIKYFSNSWATFNPKNVLVYIAAIAIAIAPFYLFKPQKWFRFKPYAGKIITAEGNNIRIDRATSTHTLHLLTKSLDSKSPRKIKVKMFPGIENYYRPGNSFVYFRGIDYPVKLDYTDEELQNEQTLCHCCGHFNPKRYDRCFNCSNVLWSKSIM